MSSESDSGSSNTNNDDVLSETDDVCGTYDTSAEPLATPEEHDEYLRVQTQRERALQELNARLTGEQSKDLWCSCGNCSLELIVKAEECRCCQEVDKCKEKMDEEGLSGQCFTQHPGFQPVCLNPYVLKVAGLSFKTRTKGCKNYTTLYNKGKKTKEEFLRAVSYRQVVRLVWDYIGSSTRYPLPCCVYARIRKKFQSKNFVGFEEDENSE